MTRRATVDPIALLSDLLLDGDQRAAARAYGGRAAPAVAALIRAGLLVPDGVLDTTICDACDEYHLVEVAFDAARGTHGWRCPEAGFVTADPDSVAALSISTNRVVEALSNAFTDAFGRRRWTPRPLDGTDAWIVGTWPIGGASTTVVLARGLVAAAASRRTRDALAELPPNEAGLVLTIGDDAGFEPPRRFAAIPLAASMVLTGEFRLSVVADLIVRVVAPHAAARIIAHVGRPGVEAKVFAVLDGLDARGELRDVPEGLSGVVARAWEQFHPNEAAPRPSTLRRHIAVWRSRGAI